MVLGRVGCTIGNCKTATDICEEIKILLGVPNDYTALNLVVISEKGENKVTYTV